MEVASLITNLEKRVALLEQTVISQSEIMEQLLDIIKQVGKVVE